MRFSDKLAKCFVIGFAAAMMASLTGCDDIKYDTEYQSESPSGEKTVTVKVDYVSRPDVFYNDECIFAYDGSGFTETEYWKVWWVSEHTIILYLDGDSGEHYRIEIPDE